MGSKSRAHEGGAMRTSEKRDPRNIEVVVVESARDNEALDALFCLGGESIGSMGGCKVGIAGNLFLYDSITQRGETEGGIFT